MSDHCIPKQGLYQYGACLPSLITDIWSHVIMSVTRCDQIYKFFELEIQETYVFLLLSHITIKVRVASVNLRMAKVNKKFNIKGT